MLKGILIAALVFTSAASIHAADEAAARIKHGKYIVHHVAMCIYCHTPKNDAGELKMQELLTGAPMPVQSPYANQVWGFQAPNLRSLPSRWGQKEFIRFLRTGRTPNGYLPRPPMPPFRMTEEDAQAVAAYLDSVKIAE